MTVAYVADTVALARYLEDNLPRKADEVFEKAEAGAAIILVPDIVIAEFIYIGLKGRLKVPDPRATISELLSDIETSQFLRAVGMTSSGWSVFVISTLTELHDKLIYSTAVSNHADAIITNDPEIVASTYQTIW